MITSVGAVCNHCGDDIVSVVVVLRYHDMHITSVGNSNRKAILSLISDGQRAAIEQYAAVKKFKFTRRKFFRQ